MTLPRLVYERATIILPDSDDQPDDSRTTFSIITTCFTAIFLCTWTSMHPNVPNIERHSNQPGSNQRHLNHRILLFWDKAKLMLVAVIAPELITLWAIRQRHAAGQMVKKYGQYGWTRAHTFLALMGGFAFYDNDRKFLYHLWDPDYCQHAENWDDQVKQKVKLSELLSIERVPSPLSPLNPTPNYQCQCLLEYCADKGYITITEEEIWRNTSQSDLMAKAVTMVHTLQFVIHCIARGIKKLPITDLECLTLGFAALNVVTYALWWDKPYRVESPIPVIVAPRPLPYSPPAAQEGRSNCSLITRPVTMSGEWMSGIFQAFNERIKVDYYKNTDFPAWHLLFILPTKAFARLFGQALSGDASKPFAAPERGNLFTGSTIGEGKLVYAAAYSAAVGLDQKLWIIFAIMIIALPLGIGIMHVLTHEKDSKGSVPLSGFAVYIFSFVYAVARIALMVLAIKQLTYLPDAALLDVSWTNYIPHIVF
ncbi:hypothetical protein V5O48_011187 [Marasmius crinis-equi]|uniref:Uncharacterized protein n=1 Tax=Marasmius crinis-equi TaxID=585013 RepID=A0ABR3F6D9_9AGAR